MNSKFKMSTIFVGLIPKPSFFSLSIIYLTFFSQLFDSYRDARTDFCQARPIVNSKAFKIIY